ncbi:MAG: SpoIIE family protein phosphatase [Planctomycetales bacterium]|nr:SpoIIE family protein phosphatase [Planctomycetales bacterium]
MPEPAKPRPSATPNPAAPRPSGPRPAGAPPRPPTGRIVAKPAAPPPEEPLAEAPPLEEAPPAAEEGRGGARAGARRPSERRRRREAEGEGGPAPASGPPTTRGKPVRGPVQAPRDYLKPEGLPLALKFAMIVSGAILVLMSIYSVIVYGIASSSISQQVEDDGVIAVSLAAQIGEEYYILSQINEELYKPPEPKEDEDDDTKIARRKKTESWNAKKKQTRDRYIAHLRHLLYFDIEGEKPTPFRRLLDVYILDMKQKKAYLAATETIGGYRGSAARKFEWDGRETDIEIIEGTYARANEPIVAFTKPVYDRYKEAKGSLPYVAHVFLSGAEIAAAKNKLKFQMVIWLVLSILAGVGLSFGVARLVTRPVKQLLEDIHLVSQGDFAHRTEASSKDEVGMLARAFDAMTQSLAAAREKEIENQQRQHELHIATEIQANLLPKKIPRIPGFDFDAYYRPSKEVGGDYYDFIPIDDTHLGLIVADVSGKGVPGSMVMTMARSLIRLEAGRNLSAADTLVKTNRIIAADIRRGMFVTALYAILDIPNRTILVSSAGHNPMVIWRKESNGIQLVNPNGIALGFDRGPIFERTAKEQLVRLGKGDRVVMYTDGVVESMNKDHEEFGDKHFYQLVQKVANRNSNQVVNIIVTKLDEHQGDAEQHDDITMLTFMVE